MAFVFYIREKHLSLHNRALSPLASFSGEIKKILFHHFMLANDNRILFVMYVLLSVAHCDNYVVILFYLLPKIIYQSLYVLCIFIMYVK